MSDADHFVEQAPRLSLRNRQAIEQSDKISCYFCLEVQPSDRIKVWLDDEVTAVCPKCGTDAIVPGEVDRGILEMALVKWFGTQIGE